ncbi:MAG TPA: hypothetical protein VGB76_22270 [Pyrinomonadaceae bacterium]|jgi:hypothetical protein
MKQINIKRDNTGKVTFDTVSVDTTENVFFTNLDPQAEHWPAFANQQPFTTNKLGAAPSPNSSQCPVPPPSDLTPPNNQVTYGCQIAGHQNEKGTINVFAPLAAADNTTLASATKGKPIAAQPVVVGGMSPYAISGQQFQVTDKNGNVLKSGAGIGPGLTLNPSPNSDGISVTGTPTMSGTYNFTFTVNDAMGRNLQQTQYVMVVT